MKKTVSTSVVILVTSIFLVVFNNITFYKNVLEVYPLNLQNSIFLFSLGVVLASVLTLLFSLVNSKYTLKPVIITALLTSAFLNYFMVTYNLVIDDDMIRNSIQTDTAEAFDLITTNMFLYLLFLGVLPSFVVYKLNIEHKSFKAEMLSKIKFFVSVLLIIVVVFFSLSKFYTSFFREHKPLRYYTNPTYFIYSIGKYISKTFDTQMVFKTIGNDAKQV